MLLSLTTTVAPATDFGFLLHKNPGSIRSVRLWFGQAQVFFPEATKERCTATLLLEVDPVGLVRKRRRGVEAGSLEPYVNDRPYVASSFMSVALAKVFGTAMTGRCDDRPELAASRIPLEVHLPVLPCRGGVDLLHRLFEPLGYDISARAIPLDERFDAWGPSLYLDARLQTTARLADVLNHLYVLLPVLDDQKHYWVADDEIEKLLRRGVGWLADHPESELITRRYLRHHGGLAREALARLLEEDQPDPDLSQRRHDREEEQVEERLGLRDQRIAAVTQALKDAGARSVLDLGCGDGRLLQSLLRDGSFAKVVGVDVSFAALERAARRLHLDEMSPKQRERIELLQGSLTYRDRRLLGFDGAALVEVIEHLEPARFGAFERVLFDIARPSAIVLTTPNAEYNVRFERLPPGSLRHRDHRFEWTRDQFRGWADGVAERSGYTVRYVAVGPEDDEVGSPTQMGVFSR
jgi:3' terminal RNA ribose 2'-O-methyltransferase Hen1